MRVAEKAASDYPDELLREWAKTELRAQRCSEKYLQALRHVLSRMSSADLRGELLRLSSTVSYAPRQVMRRILEQMTWAGYVKSWSAGGETHYAYRGAPSPRRAGEDAATEYEKIQRAAEDAALERHYRQMAIQNQDCPY